MSAGLLVGVFLGATVAAEKDTYVNIITALSSPKPYNGADRHRILTAINQHCSKWLSVLPRNTPDETKWLQDEIDSNDSQRMIRVLQTNEYARDWLLSRINECLVFSSDALIALDKRSCAETAYLIELGRSLSNDFEYYSKKAGITNKDLLDAANLIHLTQDGVFVAARDSVLSDSCKTKE